MVLISKILYFISHHGFLTVLLLILVLGSISYWRKKFIYAILIIPLAIANAFASQFLNALFLNKYGTESLATLVADEQTNSTLNDQYIHDYEAIVKKPDGKYISTYFSTTSAAIYPITNAIRIPSINTTFPVKYIPGYEKNIVILYNKSEDGQRFLRYEKLRPIETARIKYEADRTNKEFVAAYIGALKDYTQAYNDEQSARFKQRIMELEAELIWLK